MCCFFILENIRITGQWGDKPWGYAGDNQPLPKAEEAIALIRANKANSFLTTTHELGHLFSCEHYTKRKKDGFPEDVYDYAQAKHIDRVWKRDLSVRTAVSQNVFSFTDINLKGKRTKIPYFSSPDVPTIMPLWE